MKPIMTLSTESVMTSPFLPMFPLWDISIYCFPVHSTPPPVLLLLSFLTAILPEAMQNLYRKCISLCIRTNVCMLNFLQSWDRNQLFREISLSIYESVVFSLHLRFCFWFGFLYQIRFLWFGAEVLKRLGGRLFMFSKSWKETCGVRGDQNRIMSAEIILVEFNEMANKYPRLKKAPVYASARLNFDEFDKMDLL